MKYTQIGKYSVPLIGQGCASIGEDSSVDYVRNVREGIVHGLSLIDTAEVYGDGESEKVIGKAIKGLRDTVFICTKVSPNHLSYKDILLSADNSLKRLGTDVIDLYQIHWPNDDVNIDEIMDAFEHLHETKKVRYFGVSNFLPTDFEKINIRELNFVTNQIEYNLFDRFAEKGIIPYFDSLGMKTISYSPLNRGDVGGDVMNALSEKYGKTVSQIALNWLSSNGIISIPASSNIDHIMENASSCDFEMDKDDLDLITDKVRGEITYVNTSQIVVADGGYGGHKVYYTKEEALENKYDFCPSPKDIASVFLSASEDQLSYIKPVRVMDENGKLNLYEGRIRYWAWTIAFGDDRPIPIYIVKKG